MRRFIQKLLIYSFIAVLVFVSTLSAVFKRAGNSSYYQLPDSVKVLIMGHSRPEAAFNDRLLSSTINISQVAESYLFTYAKLNVMLNNKSNIKAVLLEFSNNNLIKSSMDDWNYSSKSINYQIPKYLPILEKADVYRIFKENYVGLLKTVPLALKRNALFLMNSRPDHWRELGGFVAKEGCYIDSVKESQNQDSLGKFKIAEENLNDLDRIVTLCKSKKIQLIFLRSPVHKRYDITATDPLYFNILRARYSGIPLIDLSHLELADTDFYDLHHLNVSGAAKSTMVLRRHIGSILINTN